MRGEPSTLWDACFLGWLVLPLTVPSPRSTGEREPRCISPGVAKCKQKTCSSTADLMNQVCVARMYQMQKANRCDRSRVKAKTHVEMENAMGRFVIMLFMACLVIDVSEGRSEDKPAPAGTKPLLSMHGRFSKIKSPKVLRITNAEDWRALWLEHKTGSSKLEEMPVDLEYMDLVFEKLMAIVIFKGQGSNCNGYTLDTIGEVDGRILVRMDTLSFQSAGVPGDKYRSQAWGIIVLPRSNRGVVLETCTWFPAKTWHELKRFPALTEKNR